MMTADLRAKMDGVQAGINDRQQELQLATDILATEAQKVSRRATVSKVPLIFLGAVVATREAADQLLGESSPVSIVAFAAVGLMITVIAGLEAAFKWENRAAELSGLAAECQATLRSVDSQWHREVGGADSADQVSSALALLETQDARLEKVQTRATALGVNITLEVRDLVRDRQPYQA